MSSELELSLIIRDISESDPTLVSELMSSKSEPEMPSEAMPSEVIPSESDPFESALSSV